MGDDAWLSVTFDKGKHFASGELQLRARDKDLFRLSLKDNNDATPGFRRQTQGPRC